MANIIFTIIIDDIWYMNFRVPLESTVESNDLFTPKTYILYPEYRIQYGIIFD